MAAIRASVLPKTQNAFSGGLFRRTEIDFVESDGPSKIVEFSDRVPVLDDTNYAV